MKKKSTAKKSDAKKDAKPGAAETSKADKKEEEKPAEEEADAAVEADGDAAKEAEGDDAKDEEETVSDLSKAPHQRQHSSSISQQSKMRSSSFRSSSGPLSPSHEFPPEENTAPDIYRKQAVRIEELEKENKRLAKEAGDGERRWKKAEDELEELREAEGDTSSKAKGVSSTEGSSKQLDKLVCRSSFMILTMELTASNRNWRSQRFSAKTPSSKRRPRGLLDTAHHLQCRSQRHRNWRLPYNQRTQQLSLWKLRYQIYERS